MKLLSLVVAEQDGPVDCEFFLKASFTPHWISISR